MSTEDMTEVSDELPESASASPSVRATFDRGYEAGFKFGVKARGRLDHLAEATRHHVGSYNTFGQYQGYCSCGWAGGPLDLADHIDQVIAAAGQTDLVTVPRSFVESVLYSGSFDRAQLDDLHRRAQELLDG